MTRPFAALLALVSVACRSGEWVEGPGFVLSSPFTAPATATWATEVERELADVAALLGRPRPEPPIEVHLEPITIAPDADLLAHLAPAVDGAKGWTRGNAVHVFVPREGEGLFTLTANQVLRHEFVHALLDRARIEAPAWLGEGLAHEAEFAVRGADGLHLHPAPAEFELARIHAHAEDSRRLWSWDGMRRSRPDEESALRLLAWSFVRFLIEREGEAWPRAVDRWASLQPEEDPSLLASWHAWLDGWDFASRVVRGLHDRDAAVRAAAAGVLPSLAEWASRLKQQAPGVEDAIGARTDAAAVEMAESAETACAEAAGRYLVYFRARQVSDDAVRRLMADSQPPWTRLIAFAVAARRGDHVDPALLPPLWGSLSPEEQVLFAWLRYSLPLPPATSDGPR